MDYLHIGSIVDFQINFCVVGICYETKKREKTKNVYLYKIALQLCRGIGLVRIILESRVLLVEVSISIKSKHFFKKSF